MTATDPDGDDVTYGLTGTDASSFSIVSTSGQLRTSASLDYETKSSYSVTVSVRDSKDANGNADTATDDTIDVTINVTDGNDHPTFSSTSTSRSVPENTPSGRNIGSPVAATDPDGDTLTYTLGGTDASSFSIVSTSGQLRTSAALDYETKSSYSVTVSVRDSKDADGNADTATDDTIDVTINVGDEEEAPVFLSTESGVREIGENATAGEDIGHPVAATDDDGDSLTYTLGGTDSASFAIVSSSGQLQTKAALDYESKTRYSVTVTATDSTGLTATRAVIINVADVNERPTFSGVSTTLENPENTPGGTDIGSPVSADDPEGDALTYGLIGKDASLFSVETSTGQLKARTPFDYERDSVLDYTVVVWVRDSKDANGNADTARDAAITVTISVTDADDPGSVTLSTTSPSGPLVGDTVSALLEDQDLPRGQQWQWQRSMTGTGGWEDIPGATSAAYQVTASDEGRWLQARVVYQDNFGSGKSVTSSAISVPEQVVPVISIARHPTMPEPPDGVAEGGEAVFVVSASFSPREEITVSVLLEIPFGDHPLPDYVPLQHAVELSPTANTAEIRLRTEQDNNDESNGNIFARLQDGEGYIVHSTPSLAFSRIIVIDDELPGVPISPGASGSIVYENEDGTGAITRKPIIWWSPPANAQGYEMTIAPETCPPNSTEIPRSCTAGDSVPIRRITGTSRELEASEYQADTLYRVYIRAFDTTLNKSGWAGPVFVYPTSEVPVPETVKFGLVRFPEIATAPIFSYIPMTGSAGNEQVQLRYTICSNTLPTTAIRVETITGAVNTWRTVERRKGLDLMSTQHVSPHPAGSCAENISISYTPDITEIRFIDDDGMDHFECRDDQSGCYRAWEHWHTAALVADGFRPRQLFNFPPGMMLLREDPVGADSWNDTSPTHEQGCPILQHVVAHEVTHILGTGLLVPWRQLEDHPSLVEESLGSNIFDGHIRYCEPRGYDAVTAMFNYQNAPTGIREQRFE